MRKARGLRWWDAVDARRTLRGRLSGWLLGAVLVALSGCESDPEDSIVGCWTESDWRYERVDAVAPATEGRSHRRVLRHEAEYWELLPGGEIVIGRRDGRARRARWRLKGRGHVLTLRFPDTGEVEVYKVQELDDDELVLHYDLGMEVRGIARLTFRRGGAAPERSRAATCASAAVGTTGREGGRS